jgi:hypothetical protein
MQFRIISWFLVLNQYITVTYIYIPFQNKYELSLSLIHFSDHRGKDFTKTLLALLAIFSFSAVVTFFGAIFHSITLGY